MNWPDAMQDGWRLAAVAHPECEAEAPDAPPLPDDPRAFVARVAPRLRARPDPVRVATAPPPVRVLLGGPGRVRRRFRAPPGLLRFLARTLAPEERTPDPEPAAEDHDGSSDSPTG